MCSELRLGSRICSTPQILLHPQHTCAAALRSAEQGCTHTSGIQPWAWAPLCATGTAKPSVPAPSAGCHGLEGGGSTHPHRPPEVWEPSAKHRQLSSSHCPSQMCVGYLAHETNVPHVRSCSCHKRYQSPALDLQRVALESL